MWSYLQSWFLEIRGPISRAGSLKYVVLNPELVPVLVPCNTWSYLQSFFLGIHSNISRAAAGTKAGSLKYLVLSPKLVPAFSMVPSLEMVPWNTWSYLQSWYLYLFPVSISGDGSLKYVVLSQERVLTFSAVLYLPPFLDLVPAFSMVPSLEMVPWNTWSYLQSWYLPFPWFHLWGWSLEICGPISATIHGAGTSLFRVSISGNYGIIYWKLSIQLQSRDRSLIFATASLELMSGDGPWISCLFYASIAPWTEVKSNFVKGPYFPSDHLPSDPGTNT